MMVVGSIVDSARLQSRERSVLTIQAKRVNSNWKRRLARERRFSSGELCFHVGKERKDMRVGRNDGSLCSLGSSPLSTRVAISTRVGSKRNRERKRGRRRRARAEPSERKKKKGRGAAVVE